jgi:hypothetical protein
MAYYVLMTYHIFALKIFVVMTFDLKAFGLLTCVVMTFDLRAFVLLTFVVMPFLVMIAPWSFVKMTFVVITFAPRKFDLQT